MSVGEYLISIPIYSQKFKAVVDGEITSVSLADYRDKYVVLLFYPLDFTFVCPTELVAFNDKVNEFKQRNVQVLGVSVDSEHAHLAWTKQERVEGGLGNMDFPLVSDIKKELAYHFNVLAEYEGVSYRGMFIIDPNSRIRIAHVNDLPIGRNVDEVLRLVDAIQFHEEHGEVCPANWRKGLKGMKGNPKESKAYFREKFGQNIDAKCVPVNSNEEDIVV